MTSEVHVVHPVITAVFCCVLAIVFAAIEIESEGKYGWAERMPTWYRVTGFPAQLYGFFMQKKPLTGYHMWMFFLPILMFHFPFVFGTEWTSAKEVRAWILYLAWTPLWDYYWFILNPYYGVKGFNKHTVWWHTKSPWISLGPYGIPVDYVYPWLIAIVFGALADDTQWTQTLLFVFIVATLFVILVSPLYHRFYWHMRRRDDRPLANITHHDPIP